LGVLAKAESFFRVNPRVETCGHPLLAKSSIVIGGKKKNRCWVSLSDAASSQSGQRRPVILY
jgi:hypothetical protein